MTVEGLYMPDNRTASRQRALRSRKTGKSQPQWPCLARNIAVGVAPLRDLTGDSKQQCLIDGLTDRLVSELFRRCRGFSFSWLPGEQHWAPELSPPTPAELKYVVSGSPAGQFQPVAAGRHSDLGRSDG
jgi:hypothetical protein